MKDSDDNRTAELPELPPADIELPLEIFKKAGSLRLTGSQAYALAELCKRITWAECRGLSVSEDECRLMIQATDLVRGALAANGFTVR